MMTEAAAEDDLAWDYTADECSPLLRRRRYKPCTLTHTQAQSLLNSLSEAVQILNAKLRRGHQDDEHTVEPVSNESRICILYHRSVGYSPAVTITLQILAVFIETVIDAASRNRADTENKPYTAAVFVSFGAAFSVLFYVDVMRRFLAHRVTFLTLLASFISSSVLFANAYAVFYCFDRSVWSTQAAIDPNELYVVTFLRMIHISISVFTFSQDASRTQVKAWYPLTVFSIQMLLAYSHLLIVIVTIMSIFHPCTNFVSVIPNSHVESSLPQHEPDTESLSFGTHTLNVVSSPVNVEHHDGVHSEVLGALLVSNSI